MNISIFEHSITSSVDVLKKCGFLKKRGKSIQKEGVSSQFKKASYSSDYITVYKAGIQNLDYDILLFDNSFLQFEFLKPIGEPAKIRYAFFQNPRLFYTYEEFLNILRQDGLITTETNEEIGDSLYDDYDQFLLEQNINPEATTIRYDADTNGYRPLIHSYSHIHIGHQNHIRIPSDKIISPIKFILFVLKHVYYEHWKYCVTKPINEVIQALNKAKISCPTVDTTLWGSIEKDELYLT